MHWACMQDKEFDEIIVGVVSGTFMVLGYVALFLCPFLILNLYGFHVILVVVI